MYRVELKDKTGTPYSLARPEDYLSVKSLDRRRRQGLQVDSTDLPINPAYISAVSTDGVEVVSRSKWNNTLLVRCKQPERVRQLLSLPLSKA